MAEAVVRLGLDPAGMVAGARVASASVARIGQSATQMATSATRQVQRVGTAGTRAGQQFGRGMATGAQQGAAQFARVIDQAARQAQSRLSAIRPAPIRMPAVQQSPTTGGAQTPASFFAGHRQRTQPAALGPVAPGAFFESHRRRTGQAAPMRPEAFRPTPVAPTPVAPAPATGGGRRESLAPRRQSDQWGGDGIGRLWALSALGGQIRGVVQRGVQTGERNIGIASERQVARAEARTVIEGDADRALVRESARDAALGRGAMVVPVSETDYTNAVFRGVASGLDTQEAIDLVPAAANLALAGQTRPAVAGVGLTDVSNIFGDHTFAEIADVYARGQDIGSFPRGIQDLFTATTKAASTAEAAGLSFAETVATVTTLSSLGPTFRGATGGQKALMAIRELDLGGLQKLGIRAVRDEEGGLDFPATLRMLAAADLSGVQVVEAVGKRAAPALIALIDSADKYRATLGELDNATGTAAANAMEHADTLASRAQRREARREVFQAGAGEGAAAAREVGLRVHDAILSAAVAVPGLANAAGFAVEAGSRVGQLAGAGLDTAVGVHAFKQLAGGTLNPLNLFRSGASIDQRRQARLQQRNARAMGRGVTQAGRQWRGLFSTMARGTGTARRGFTGLFRGVLRGGMRVGGMIAAELAASFASRAASGLVAPPAAVAAKGLSPGAMAVTAGAVSIVAGGVVLLAAAKVSEQLVDPAGEAGERFGLWTRNLFRGLLGKEPLDAAPNEITVPDEGFLKRAFFPAYPTLTPKEDETVAPPRQPAAPTQPTAAPTLAAQAGFGPGDILRAGVATPATLASGMTAGNATVASAADAMAQTVADRTPQSDAKVGPLSNLTARGMAIPMTLAEGVTLGAPVLAGAVAEMFTAAGLPEPVTLAAPDTLAPDPVTLDPIGPPDMLAPDPLAAPASLAPRPIAMPDPLAPTTVDAPALIPPDPLAPPAALVAATLPAPDPIAAPVTIPPAAVVAPDTAAPDSATVPPLVPPVAIAAPPLLAPPATVAAAPLIEPEPVTAPATVPPGPATSPPLVPPDQLLAPPPLAPESFTASAMLAPLPATAPPTLAPPPAAIAAPATLAPDPIAAPSLLAPDPLAPDPLAPPDTEPPAAITAPALLAPDPLAEPPMLLPEPIAAPSLLAPDPLTADPPLFGPPALTETPAIPYAPAPLPAPQDETGGVVPPGAPADVLGALAGVSDPDLVVALASLLSSNRELVTVNLRVLEEMRRKRRAGDGRGQQRDERRPADAIDYDTAGEILEGVL